MTTPNGFTPKEMNSTADDLMRLLDGFRDKRRHDVDSAYVRIVSWSTGQQLYELGPEHCHQFVARSPQDFYPALVRLTFLLLECEFFHVRRWPEYEVRGDIMYGPLTMSLCIKPRGKP